MQSTQIFESDVPAQATHVGRYRWRICALLLFATTINYIDRQVLGVLAPDLQRYFAWSEIEYGYIGGFGGAVGGMMIATFTGFLLETTGSYVPVFLMAGTAYLLALAVVHALAPRLAPARIE